MAALTTQHVDDGWEIAPSRSRETRSRLDLIREALRILDGEEPEELVVEGDGWSLVDPESVVARRASAGHRLTTAIAAALDEAAADGWLLADEEPG